MPPSECKNVGMVSEWIHCLGKPLYIYIRQWIPKQSKTVLCCGGIPLSKEKGLVSDPHIVENS